MGKFQDLKVWQQSKDLAAYVYKITGQNKFVKDFALRDQMKRAAISIPSNIAEGDELDTNKQSIKFFYIAKGSAAELLTQAIISIEIGYLNLDDFTHVSEECKIISGMLGSLIAVRSKSLKP